MYRSDVIEQMLRPVVTWQDGWWKNIFNKLESSLFFGALNPKWHNFLLYGITDMYTIIILSQNQSDAFLQILPNVTNTMLESNLILRVPDKNCFDEDRI